MIEGITVSVNYAEELARTLPGWMKICDHVCVVTTPTDDATIEVVFQNRGATYYPTEKFYEDGATFNKAGALEQARHTLNQNDWLIFFDADIVAPAPERMIRVDQLEPGNLYGARRRLENGTDIREGGCPGFFWMFHGSDPALQRQPWFDDWKHAGSYDSEFEKRWPRKNRIVLPLLLTHIGKPGRNWWGKGNEAAMEAMIAERREKRGYQHERIIPVAQSAGSAVRS